MSINEKLHIPSKRERITGVARDLIDVGIKSTGIYLLTNKLPEMKIPLGLSGDLRNAIPFIAPYINFFTNVWRDKSLYKPALVDSTQEQNRIRLHRVELEATRSVLMYVNPVLASVIINSPWPNSLKGVALTSLVLADAALLYWRRSIGPVNLPNSSK